MQGMEWFGGLMKTISLVGLMALTLIGCGGSSSLSANGSEDTGAPATSGTLEDVTEVSFDSENHATINFNDLTADDTYLIGIYSYQTATEDSISFNLSDEDLTALVTTEALVRASTVPQTDFHNLLRDNETGFQNLDKKQIPAALIKSATVGDSRSFNVLNDLSDTSSFDTVTAELRVVTDDFYVYVDVRNADALSDDDLNELVDPFQNVIDEERELFGEESDVDGDDHSAILLTQAVNELGAMSGGIISGFFYGADLYSEDVVAGSNEMEIIYTMVPDPSGDFGSAISKNFALSNILPSVLPHEFQHMISYNQHVFVGGGEAEISFLNEGLSHLAEDIYSINSDGYMTETGIENPSRVSLYLSETADTCFTCGSNITQRGGSYLFMRYLYEQAQQGNLSAAASGSILVERLMSSDVTGIANILNAALDSEVEADFQMLLANFSVAIALSDTGLTTNNHYQFDGIDLRGEQNDNRGTVLSGPSTMTADSLDITGTLNSSGITYVEISGQDLIDNGGEWNVAVDEDASIGAFILQIIAE